MEKVIKKRWLRFVLVLVCVAVLFFLLDLILSKWIFYTEYHPNTSVGSSSEALSAYCKYVNSKKEKLANAGLEDIIVTITFSKPLDQAEYDSYVKAYDIRVYSSKMRGVQPDGTRTSGGAWFDWTGVGSTDDRHNSKLIGAVAIDGYIDSENLLEAISDPNSYLVDTSRDAYWGGLFRSKGETRNNWTKGCSPAEIFNLDLAWLLEDHGIAGYSYYLPYQEIAKEKARLNSLPAE